MRGVLPANGGIAYARVTLCDGYRHKPAAVASLAAQLKRQRSPV